MNTSTSAAWIRAGLFALPLQAVLVGYATLRPEPDQVTDPEAWARFVSSTSYLVQHVLGNVVGTVLAVFGTFALAAYLVVGRATRSALWGMTLAITAHILFTVPGMVSTFTTPAIGSAYLAGNKAAMTVELSPVLMVVFGLALLLALVGNLMLGAAVWRSGRLPRWPGLVWAAATLVFYLLGAVLGLATTGASLPTQPIGAALMVVAGGAIAWSARRQHPSTPAAVKALAPLPVGQGSR
jgi:uncharacterized membrane protein YhaH (DUF805 family)